ncbi:MAG: dienelactone hydrolase family protein [Gemmatimonadaceae bacterium]
MIDINGTTGYLAIPETGSGPGLLVIQEYWGLVDHIKRVADRMAAAGFVALAPDLYHGEVAKSPDAAGKMLMALNIAQAGKDMSAAARALLDHDAVTSEQVGIMGFCMGGQLALYAACEYPEVIACAVDFYGIHPKVELRVEQLGGPVQCHFAERDKSTPRDVAKALCDRIAAAGKRADCYFYSADHAFFNDTRPDVFNAGAAALAFERTTAFLGSSL